VETLLGDPSKAHARLGWKPRVRFHELVAEMAREDLLAARRDQFCRREGFRVFDYHE
jgi:GDPmannose 4,6-dehydratase